MENLRQEIHEIICKKVKEFEMETFKRSKDLFSDSASGFIDRVERNEIGMEEGITIAQKYGEFVEERMIEITNEVMAAIRRYLVADNDNNQNDNNQKE